MTSARSDSCRKRAINFPTAAAVTYLLAVALREAKQAQASVATFEEALHESEAEGQDVANGRFYFEYGAAAERAGLYDKAAELFKQSIATRSGGRGRGLQLSRLHVGRSKQPPR